MSEKELKKMNAESGNAVVIVLVVLVIVAVGALAYLSGQIASEQSQLDSTEVAASEKTQEAEISNAEPASGAEKVQPEAQAETAAKDVEVKPGNPVVAKIDDVEITRFDVVQFIQQLPEQMRQAPLTDLFPLALEQTINSKLVDIKVPQDEVLKDERVKLKLQEAKVQILRNAFVEMEVEKELSDERIQGAYEEYKKNFPKAEEVKAAHILVEDEEKAKEVIQKLNDGGDFAELAAEYSKDPTSANGGELGYFSKSEVVPEFAVAAFGLKKDAYTKEPVKSQFGYHVIRLDDRRMREPASYEQAKLALEPAVRRQILEAKMKEWRESVKIERFDINGDPKEDKSAESN